MISCTLQALLSQPSLHCPPEWGMGWGMGSPSCTSTFPDSTITPGRCSGQAPGKLEVSLTQLHWVSLELKSSSSQWGNHHTGKVLGQPLQGWRNDCHPCRCRSLAALWEEPLPFSKLQ